jgi:hypothetical protein
LKGLAGHAIAAEGAASNYFPGSYGTLLVAVAPEPGPLFSDLNLFYSAEADRAVLEGRVDTDIETYAFYTLLQGYYIWDVPAIGGRFGIGGYVPLGYSSLEANVGSESVDDDNFGLGDMGFVPASFYWNTGNFNFNLYELIIVPTGEYDVSETVNIGRNYWSFDTVIAATWFNAEAGTEISVIPGLMINTENPDTNYRTGTEFHVDAVVNQFLSETFAVGIVGYAYKQIEGDSGDGAILGDFKGESYGLGPALSWVPEFGGGNIAITGQWLHDLHATNRLEADYGALTIAVSF